jgi:hypothetical protein
LKKGIWCSVDVIALFMFTSIKTSEGSFIPAIV